uniref:ubiquitinyl hydrolase 1 n=1 Tax=Rousettus aegyptiacus TaxID=9407 RepID=A0A7J8CIQ4_ROUAE|nr:hypothetical protein HJG63_009123 [Rousettus aegyptiacus]
MAISVRQSRRRGTGRSEGQKGKWAAGGWALGGGVRGPDDQWRSRQVDDGPLSQLALPQVLGLILNLPSPVSLGLLSLPLRRRHWVALRQVDGIYYNLDSKLRAPEALGDEDGVRAFLAAALAQGLCEVLLVVTKEVEEKGAWLQTD